MTIQYFNAKQLSAGVKATVHNTGRLGFSRSAEEVLKLHSVKSVTIGRGGDYQAEGVLYLIPDTGYKPESFVVRKAGPYYYAFTRHLFRMLGEDFEKKKIVFDIEAETVDGQQVFKLKRRLIERKKLK
jgi:hypothetical protein